MNVVHLITNLGIGGAERMLLNLLTTCDIDPFKHTVVYFHHGPIAEQLRAFGIKTIQIKGIISPYDMIGLWRLWRVIRAEKPDLIHAALWSANICARVLGYMLAIPVICDLHSDCTYHGALRNALDRLTHTHDTQYVAVATSVATAYQKEVIGVRPAQLMTLYNGIDTALYQVHDSDWINEMRKRYAIGPQVKIIGAVGRLVSIKRYDVLLRAAAELIAAGYQIHLIIVGDGPERLTLESLAHVLGITSYVTFMGVQQEIQRWYQLFDIFVSCSQSEGMSMVVLEALAAGRPIVVTSATSKHEVIEHGKTGIVIPVGSFVELATTLAGLLADSAMCARLGQQARTAAREKFDIVCAVQKYHELYLDVIKRGAF